MSRVVTWDGSMTALSSIAHSGDSRATVTMLRRELVVQPDRRAVPVPLISGNSFRGRLRRIGESLLREVLDYDGQLPLAAAHALRGGGALAKTGGEPLSGSRLAELRDLIPQVGVFGTAAGGRVIDGCLQVGKVMPVVFETAHILGLSTDGLPTVFQATQLEAYRRADDSDRVGFAQTLDVEEDVSGDRGSQLMLFRVETFPAGTEFRTWLRLEHPSDDEVDFFLEVLDVFGRSGRLGGRVAAGHGQVRLDLRCNTELAPRGRGRWRRRIAKRRSEALNALRLLT